MNLSMHITGFTYVLTVEYFQFYSPGSYLSVLFLDLLVQPISQVILHVSMLKPLNLQERSVKGGPMRQTSITSINIYNCTYFSLTVFLQSLNLHSIIHI